MEWRPVDRLAPPAPVSPSAHVRIGPDAQCPTGIGARRVLYERHFGLAEMRLVSLQVVHGSQVGGDKARQDGQADSGLPGCTPSRSAPSTAFHYHSRPLLQKLLTPESSS